MATNKPCIEIPNRFKSLNNSEDPAIAHIVAGADDIYDDDKAKKQSVVNQETDTALDNRYTKDETYSKNELNNLITTPNQQYVSVTATDQTTAVTDVLPAEGSADTVYRVGNWDGTQYDDTVYSEYAWNGTSYVHLSTKTLIGEVFDISVYHATGGTLATYADLAAALGTNGANVPEALRKGGMSIKFVQSIDNKYVQCRYMLQYENTTAGNAAFANPDNWQGVDVEPTEGSKNLVESGGVESMIYNHVTIEVTGIVEDSLYNFSGKSVGDIFSSPYGTLIGSACLLIDCVSGEKYKIYGKGNSNAAKLYAIVDNTYHIVALQTTGIDCRENGLKVTIPPGGVKLYVNFLEYNNQTDKVDKLKTTRAWDSDIEAEKTRAEAAEGSLDEVKVDVSKSQSFTASQKLQGLNNLGIEGIDDNASYDSNNLIKSKDVYEKDVHKSQELGILGVKPVFLTSLTWNQGIITSQGVLDTTNTSYTYSTPVLIPAGCIVYRTASIYSGGSVISSCDYSGGVISNIKPLVVGNGGSENDYTITLKAPAYIILLKANYFQKYYTPWYTTGDYVNYKEFDVIKSVDATWENGFFASTNTGMHSSNNVYEADSTNYERTIIDVRCYKQLTFFVDCGTVGSYLLNSSWEVIDSWLTNTHTVTINIADYSDARFLMLSNKKTNTDRYIEGALTQYLENTPFDSTQIDNLKALGGKFYSWSYPSSNGYLPLGYIPNLCFVHISDTHWNYGSPNTVKTAVNLLNNISLWRNELKFLIHTGDIKAGNYQSNFGHFTQAVKDSSKPVFVTIGNHDAGGTNKSVSLCGTDQQIYEQMIEPFIEDWNLKTDGQGTPHVSGKNYYFTDFTDEKIRLIVLDQYESDFVLDPNDNTKLVANRGDGGYSQDQIDWFANSLLTTPTNYGVLVAKHAPTGKRGTTDNPFNSYHSREKSYEINYDFIPQIVQAFIDGTDLSSNPLTINQTGNIIATLTCDVDFSTKNTGSEFIAYLSGHAHIDGISFLKDFPKQLDLVVGCGGVYSTFDADCAHIAGTKSENCINAYAIDRNDGYIMVVRIGTDMSFEMQKRDVLRISYRV